MTQKRLIFAGTTFLSAALTTFWVVGAVIAWSVCCGWLISEGFTIAVSVGAAVNVVGFLAFVIRSRTWGRASLGAVQVGNVLFALVASVLVSPAWLWLDAAPAVVVLVLLILLRRFENPAC